MMSELLVSIVLAVSLTVAFGVVAVRWVWPEKYADKFPNNALAEGGRANVILTTLICIILYFDALFADVAALQNISDMLRVWKVL